MSETSLPAGVEWALVFDGAGGARELSAAELDAWRPADGFLWLHGDCARLEPELGRLHGLSDVVWEALTAGETRPRCVGHEAGLMIILRGANLQPGAEPDDLVALRLWICERMAITAASHPVHAVPDVRAALDAGRGATSAADFLVALSDAVAERLDPVVDELAEMVDEVEESLVDRLPPGLRGKLTDLRRQAISLRRYLSPQREVTVRLHAEPIVWLDDIHRVRLREVADHLMRLVEDLDMLRDHAAVLHDELTNRLSEDLNQRMYILSILAAVFVPLTFASGLLGMNVGGIPGAERANGFSLVCGVLAVVAAIQIWWFRRRRWL